MAGIHPDFFQHGPEIENPYLSDSLLLTYLRVKLPERMLAEIEPELKRFGERCSGSGDIFELANQSEAQKPVHIPYDPWGRRIDTIEVSSAWNRLHEIAAAEGLVAIGYERKHNELSRLHQFVKLYLFHPSSAFVTCPLAMTDGAARIIELFADDEIKARAFARLTSRDPASFWTSGQWMTERTGGSDVSNTSTLAKIEDDAKARRYALFGDKWFTSATTAEIALALGKVDGATDSREGLSLFYVELRDVEGRLNRIRVNRLKDKLGTKALPTAELTLEGVPAQMIGEVGEGVKKVASMLNITRLYNSVTALATIGRALQLAKDYAGKRTAFARPLADQPLHVQTLADLQTEFEGVFHLVFFLIELLGKEETGRASEVEATLLRVLTPVVKLWSAKQAIAISSEALELFGGAGYIEDTGIPRLLRDAQVFSIWEGTTNILSLDFLRATSKDGSLDTALLHVEQIASRARRFQSESALIRDAVKQLRQTAFEFRRSGHDVQQAGSRSLAFGLARTYSAALLLGFADLCQEKNLRPVSADVVRRFCRRPLFVAQSMEDLDIEMLKRIVRGL